RHDEVSSVLLAQPVDHTSSCLSFFCGDSSAHRERELPGISDEAVLIWDVMRKKMDEVLRRKISELDRVSSPFGRGSCPASLMRLCCSET
ncbi:hypothetical protein, partial [Serratia fonticola]|uniref:hypothetical protein n=1 Tax=Serratia fonticola TaxID=47917 RepID=UPI003AAE36D9